jgi:hypothetical protein
MHTSITFLLLCLVSLSSIGQSDSAASNRTYAIKSCKIVYKFFTPAQSGVKTVIFDDWGNEEKEEVTTISDTSMMRQMLVSVAVPDSIRNNMKIPAVQHNLLIQNAYKRYVIDLNKQTGYQTARPMFQVGANFFDERTVIVGEDTLLGKPCEIKEIQQTFRLWVWNKITLKKMLVQKESDLKMGEFAIEIDENYVIKPDEFMVPKNVIMR